jgi:hypothetical protein
MAKLEPNTDPLYEVSEAGAAEATAAFLGCALLVGLIVWNLVT